MRPIVLLLWLALAFELQGQGPNILFIAVDDLNCDIGAYGNRVVKSPNIDQLAAEGVLFSNNYCQQPVCGASRASLLSGFTPEHTGVTSFYTYMRDLYPDMVTLPQFFKNAGYNTVGLGKIHDPRNVSVNDGVDLQSWTQWINITGSRWISSSGKPVTEMADLDDGAYVDGKIADEAVSQIKSLAAGNEPFFLAVGFKKPHLPFVAPKRYWDLYHRDSIPLAPFRKYAEHDLAFVHNPGAEFFNGYDDVPETGSWAGELQREYIHGYYACVSFIDAQVGRLIDELRTQGIYENTIIVLWGDHGFSLGDHSNWGKHTVFEYASRSPLIFKAPDMRSGVVVHSPTEFLDIYPSLVDLAGLQVPDTLDGTSLVPVLSGAADRVKSFAVSQFRRDGKQGFALRTDHLQYVEWSQNEQVVHQQLFDLCSDPYQTVNLAGREENSALLDSFSMTLGNYLEHGRNTQDLGFVEDPGSPGSTGSLSRLSFSVMGKENEPVPLADALIRIGPFELPTGPGGYTALDLQPGDYSYTIEKMGYWPVSGQITLSAEDTMITDTLSRTHYYLSVLALDSLDQSPISGVEISTGSQVIHTDRDGRAEFQLEAGDHELFLRSEIYGDRDLQIDIRHDTLIQLLLRARFADIKISLYEGAVPVNNALVVLDQEEQYSNAIGQVRYQGLQTDMDYEFSVSKEGYQPQQGNIFLRTDTTFRLEMSPQYYNCELKFRDKDSQEPLSMVEVDLDNKVELSDDGGSAIFSLRQGTYNYQASLEGYEDQEGSLSVEEDLVVQLELAQVLSFRTENSQAPVIYPNPANDRLFYRSDLHGAQLLIMDLAGRKLISTQVRGSGSIDLSVLEEGPYVLHIRERMREVFMELLIIDHQR